MQREPEKWNNLKRPKKSSLFYMFFIEKKKSELILELSEPEQQPLPGPWTPPVAGELRQIQCGLAVLQHGSGVAQKGHTDNWELVSAIQQPGGSTA